MQSGIKSTLLAISAVTMLLTLVIGQVAPPALAQTTSAMDNLIKRDFSFGGNQHLTASSGNTVVCGDHICAPGEWTMLQDNLNHNQIVHSATNSTNAMSTNSTMSTSTNSTMPMSSNSTMEMSNSTSPIPPPYPMPPTPVPIPTPPAISPVVCSKVKADLANSTISLGVTAKILSD
ncbi:MAG: hypothetical protein ACREBA_09850, partial [Nitrosotalea sp.]